MAAVKDFGKSRISGPEEWRVIREAYAETYPVRLLLNHIDELEAAAKAVIDRWDTPLWKDAPATATFINALRTTLDRGGEHG